MKRRNWLKHIFGACCLLFVSGAGSSAQTNSFTIAPPPEWVRSVELDSAKAPSSDGGKAESTRCLLYERQEHPTPRQTFVRIIRRMENEAGVQDSGSLSFAFNP